MSGIAKRPDRPFERPTKRVLIIDDEEDIRTTLRMTLGYEGYEVDAAGSGPQGLAAATDTPPDLIFLDVKMPDMDGLEVLEKLKAQGVAAGSAAGARAASPRRLAQSTP